LREGILARLAGMFGHEGIGADELRTRREQILRTYDDNSLAVAYKVTMKMPLSTDVGHLSRDEMVDGILATEFPCKNGR
jgi:glycine cleavage system regulatory protein